VPAKLQLAGKRYHGSWGRAVEAAGIDYVDVRLDRRSHALRNDWLITLAGGSSTASYNGSIRKRTYPPLTFHAHIPLGSRTGDRSWQESPDPQRSSAGFRRTRPQG
jgi:hypothetical protein